MKRLLFSPLLAGLTACAAYPQVPSPIAPAPPMATYRAVGTEPFWALAITGPTMTFTRPEAHPVVQPTPRAIVGIAGEIYRTPRIDLNIVHAQCSDGMSDRIYPDKVQVTVDGRRFNGCGGEAVAPSTLAGTNWRVAAIDGRATPAQGKYSMSFEGSHVSARFGCNSMGGDYTTTGNVLDLAHVISTQMACHDMSFERQGSAVLNAPMTMSWTGGDRLMLSNTHGSIALVRSH